MLHIMFEKKSASLCFVTKSQMNPAKHILDASRDHLGPSESVIKRNKKSILRKNLRNVAVNAKL